MPRVSVIIPCHNCAGLVGRSIDSVLAQTYRDVEIIAVDDGSTDATLEVLRQYGDQVRVLLQENAGAASARNTGFLAATGEFINFLDSDDTFLPPKLALQVAYLDAHPDIDAVLCGWQDIREEDGEVINEMTSLPVDQMLKATLLAGNYGYLPMHPALLRRHLIDRVGLFDTSLPMREDQDFWLRLALAGCRFGQIEQVLCHYLNRAEGKGKNWVKLEQTMPLLLQKVFGHPNLPAEIAAMKDEIYARSYLEFGLYYFALSVRQTSPEMQTAHEYFSRAFALQPDILLRHQAYADAILYRTIELDADDPQARLSQALEVLLPDSAQRNRLIAYLLSRLHMILAFQAYEAGQPSRVIHNILAALRTDLAPLQDRGVRAIFARSLLGLAPKDRRMGRQHGGPP